MAKLVKIGIIGVGNMGTSHSRYIQDMADIEITAVCDIDTARADALAKKLCCPSYHTYQALLKAKVCDAVLIATPHYDHTTIGVAALKAGYHVLVEKPISVHKTDCEKLIAAHTNKKQIFGAMFNQRTSPVYKKLKAMLEGGELGRLTRINWIITDWFRTETYYKSGGWRATWAGEGGGVLLNQCPHQLDLMQWLFGMPSKVVGYCGIGKSHKIEVEDEVTAYLEYKNGATGVFITSTGEAPGTNRLEVVGTQGKVVIEGGELKFTRNEVPMDTFSKKSKAGFATPEVWNVEVPIKGRAGQHPEITANFADAIRGKAKLIAPASEGINSVELGNAMLYSSVTGKPVDMPLDGKAYARMMKKFIKESKVGNKEVVKDKGDFNDSF